MLKINFSKQSVKFLASLPPKQQRQLAGALTFLQIDPNPHDCKKLQGYDYYRIDTGEYRIIYIYDELLLNIYIIGKRNDSDVYRKLKRSQN